MLNRIVTVFSGRGYLLQPDAAEYLMRQREPLRAAEGLAARLASSQSKGAGIVTLDLLRRLEILEGEGLAVSSPEAAVLVAHAEAEASRAMRREEAVAKAEVVVQSRGEPAVVAVATTAESQPSPALVAEESHEAPFEHRILIIQDTSREPATEGSVQDFIKLFRSRLEKQREFLLRGSGIRAVRIEEAAREGTDVHFVGLVRTVKETRFKTTFLEVEDETGAVRVTIPTDLQKTMGDIIDDEVLLIRARPSASREFAGQRRLVAKEIKRPEVTHPSPPRHGGESAVAFVSDIHIGSKNFMEKEWKRFVGWLRSDDELARRVKYLVCVGDVVDGIGVYPNQEADLEIDSVREQYKLLSEITADIREDVKVIMMPGNHDAVRPAEPQPTFSDSLRRLFDRDRFMFLSNPAMVRIEETRILGYHGKSLDDIIAHVPGMSYQRPLEAMVELLRRRHIAPVYGDKTPLAPLHEDRMVMSETPDVFVTGHIHVAAMGEYRGIRLINAGAWQRQTAYQKVQNITPLPARVPIIDLRDMSMKMPSFGE